MQRQHDAMPKRFDKLVHHDVVHIHI